MRLSSTACAAAARGAAANARDAKATRRGRANIRPPGRVGAPDYPQHAVQTLPPSRPEALRGEADARHTRPWPAPRDRHRFSPPPGPADGFPRPVGALLKARDTSGEMTDT